MLDDAAPVAVVTTAGLQPRLDGSRSAGHRCRRSAPSTPNPARRCRHRPRRHRLPDLHLGHHRCAQGGGHHPPQRDPAAGGSRRPASCPRSRCGRSVIRMAFDFSVWEIWGALLGGGRLVVVPESVAGSPEDFHALLVARTGQRADPDPVGGGERCRPRVWSRWRWCSAVRPARPRWWTGGRRGG